MHSSPAKAQVVSPLSLGLGYLSRRGSMRPDLKQLGPYWVVSTSRAKGLGGVQFTPTVNPTVKGGVNGMVNPRLY